MFLYPQEISQVDIVGEEGYLDKVVSEFGLRPLRGTAVTNMSENEPGVIYNMEGWLRELFNRIKPERAVEIGTWRGVTTALLAHYSKFVLAVDLHYQEEALYLWKHFGVFNKIHFVQVENDIAKQQLLERTDFDFAFIDAEHTYDAAKLDFGCVGKCGKVLFHDYGMSRFTGITQFVDELPNEEVSKQPPFAYWERGAKWQK